MRDNLPEEAPVEEQDDMMSQFDEW
jgi:hypothetical protein